jgi:pantetheine-phosphate adenylyltransferase
MPSIAVYPGSFDPVTFGHLDILNRAAKLFDEVHVLVVHNPGKSPRFSSQKRLDLIRQSLDQLNSKTAGKITLETLEHGLLVDYCKKVGAAALVKGFRTSVDLDYELPMAQVNRDLAGVETVFIPADPQHGQISSSLVKQVSDLGGAVDKYVSPVVAQALASHAKDSRGA